MEPKEEKEIFFSIGDEVSVSNYKGTYAEGTISSIEIHSKGNTLQPIITLNITEEGYYPNQKASFWLDDIKELEILNLKENIVPNKDYESFIKKCLQDIEGLEKKDYIFKIKRWSINMPFWCIFFCERSNPNVSIIKEHYCLAIKDNTKMTDLLCALADSGVFTKVSERCFLKMEEDLL